MTQSSKSTEIPEFNSSSQFRQDLLPYYLIVLPEQKLDGHFVDIGCGDPVNFNNSFGLEQLGWRGILTDIIPDCARSCAVRQSKFFMGPAQNLSWGTLLQEPATFDYLSLDCDDDGLAVLQSLPLDTVDFRTATIEHDAYRIGNEMRHAMRAHMISHGYTLVCGDVCWNGGSPLEDWWVKGIPEERYAHLQCNNREYSEIFK
jgi:hypothetical protein